VTDALAPSARVRGVLWLPAGVPLLRDEAALGMGMRHTEYLNDWDDLRVFLAVAEAGSFTEAARQLGTVQSTVGRRIDKLEHRLGSKLFLRHRSGMKLTSNGLALADHAMRMREIANQIERRLFNSDRALAGTIRLTVTDGLAAYWLVPKIGEFQKTFPSIRLEMTATGSFVDLSSGQVDIAIRYERPADASVVSRKLGQVPFGLYGSPSYLNSYGTPRTIADVSRHKIVENTNLQINTAFADWYGLLRQHASVLSVNSAAAVLSAVQSGVGLALLPQFFKRLSPELVQVDVPIRPVSDVWLLSHIDTNKTARVRAALDYIAKQFKMDRDYFAG
jgi:DNA-binding transcriptional LysR family regulator